MRDQFFSPRFLLRISFLPCRSESVTAWVDGQEEQSHCMLYRMTNDSKLDLFVLCLPPDVHPCPGLLQKHRGWRAAELRVPYHSFIIRLSLFLAFCLSFVRPIHSFCNFNPFINHLDSIHSLLFLFVFLLKSSSVT